MRATAQLDLLNDPVGLTLYKSSVPTVLGAVAVILYYLTDTYFVSILGLDQLAALGFTFPACIMITYFGVGLGIGTSALVAKSLGAGDNQGAGELINASMLLGLLTGLLFLYPSLALIDVIFPVLGAAPERMTYIRSFMEIWYLGMPLILTQFAGTSVIRASGNPKLHGKLMTLGAVCNGILDPVFIFGFGPIPAMGIAGAALATILSWGITIIIICYVLYAGIGVSRRLPGLGHLFVIWSRHLKLTIPAALANMITPLATGILTSTIATYGPTAIAAYGVVSRVESFVLIVVLGMSMSLPPFISQNFGAKKYKRVCDGLKTSLNFVLIWQLILYVFIALSSHWIAMIFTDNNEAREIITLALRILPISYAFQGIVILGGSTFNALHAPQKGLFTSLIRFFLCYVPLALLGNTIGGLQGLFIGASIGNVIAGLFIRAWVISYSQKLTQAYM